MRSLYKKRDWSIGRDSSQSTAILSAPVDSTADEAEILDESSDRPDPIRLFLKSKRGRIILWMIALLAVVLRMLLLPIGHPWDLTVDYNVFMDLARNHSPYDTFNYLSRIAVASQWGRDYEYYAYPPVPLYIYYPLAKLYLLLHPHAQYVISLPGSLYAVPSVNLDFFFLLKSPIWVADFLIAALLARMSGTIRGFRDYLLNPYVLLISGAWTFDAIMVVGLVAGVYAIYKSKFLYAGIALAFGTMVKFFPVLAIPAILIYMVKKNRPMRDIVVFLVSYAIACVVMLGPFASGVLEVILFHGSRQGGGMTWENIWNSGPLFPPGTDLWALLTTIGAFGTITLIIVFMLVVWYMWKTEMSLNRMIIVSLLAFFIGSKLVNEQYALMIFPFAWLEAHEVKGAWRWFYRLLWIVPLTFTVFHVPIDHFFLLLYHLVFRNHANINLTITEGITGFEWTMIPWKHPFYDQVIVNILGCGFFALSIVAILWPVRRSTELLHKRLHARALANMAVTHNATAPVETTDGADRSTVLSDVE